MKVITNIIFRITVLPFIMIIALISSVRLYFRFILGFIRYGGELMTYKKINPTTIAGLLEKLSENQENK